MKDKRPDQAKIAELEDLLLDNPVEYDAELDAFRTIETRDGTGIGESILTRVFLRVDPHSVGNILIYTDQREPIVWKNDGPFIEVRSVLRTKRGVLISATDWIPLGRNRTVTFTEPRQQT